MIPYDKIDEYFEAFKHFGVSEQNELVDTKSLGKLFNALGQQPTEQELKDMLDEVDLNCSTKLSFGEYLAMMNRKTREADNEEEIMEAFKVFAKDKDGLIKFDNLRQVMDDMTALLP